MSGVRAGDGGRVARWLMVLLAVSAAVAASRGLAEEASGAFRFQEVGASSLGLWEGDRAVLVYNQGLIAAEKPRTGKARASYIHPLYGLDGEVLTDDFPADHTYHRGVYWAWPHVKIGEQEYDQWSLRSLASEFQRWTARDVSTTAATLGIENGWFVDGKQVVREQVVLRVQRASEEGRAIDVELTWTPLTQSVTLWGAEGKSYGGFNVRFARPERPVITSDTGRTADDWVVTRLPWVDYANAFSAGQGEAAKTITSGAAVLVHPTHPDYAPTWMTRHYGLISVGWPGVEPLTIAVGKPVTLKYRLWIHRGRLDSAAIAKVHQAYCSEAGAPVTWKLDRLDSIGGHAASVVGTPQVVDTPQGKAFEFDGKGDGLFLDTNPLAGLTQFTAEVNFRPDANGPKEQRFWHMQEADSDNRLLFETRLTDDGQWYLDTFAKSGEASATLLAKESLHPTGKWYHAAVTYDGQTMRHFVNGKEELKAAVKLAPQRAGRTSLGVRQNRVSWFRGAIREVRVSPRVLEASEFLSP